MDDERFRELITRVTNFEWTEPRPGAARVEFDKLIKQRRKFQSELRRDFPEWHYSSGPHLKQFVGGEVGVHGAIQPELRKVWETASAGEIEKVKRQLRKLSERFTAQAAKAFGMTSNWYSIDQKAAEVVPRSPRRKDAATLRLMVETLEWLQGRLRSLKVCENPKCATGRRYFFKVYPNDRYCSNRCTTIAKALRQAKRDAELQKTKKVSEFTDEHRRNMSIAQQERWDKQREKTGKPKYAR